jgi:tetratricopeptide (TPR) repeat protein
MQVIMSDFDVRRTQSELNFMVAAVPKNSVKISSAALAACLLLLLFGVKLSAQHNHQSMQYAPASAIPSLPAPALMKGIGTASIKITTRSQLTQQYFDQGLNLIHAFWDVEAYRAFREAAKLDPNCAMAYWGIYNALAQNSQEMATERSAALRKAVELMPAASDREQHYIRSISLLAEQGKGRPAWIAEIEALINKYPDDVEAKLLLANSLSTSAGSYLPDGRPREGKLYGQAILRNLLVTHPNHAAVHHYWLHAVENGPRPEEALASAEKLTQLAPNSGHMLHMPGHIYYRLGQYEKARKAFLASLDFDLKYMREQNVHPINNWNYTHNLDYLVANCAEEGRYTEAVKYAQMLADVPSDDDRLKSTGLGYILYGGHTALTRLQMRYGKWDEAVKRLEASRVQPDASLSGKYQSAILSYLKGMSAVEKGNAADAEKYAVELQKANDDLAAQRMQNASDWYFNHALKIVAVHLLDLRGSTASVDGNHLEAEKLLNEAIDREKNLGYWEPPHYTRPVLESLAAVYVRAGKYNDAVRAFERVLEIRPESGLAIAGIARTYKTAGNEIRSAEYARQLATVWRNADKDLLQLRETKW